jgi:hypothetical protein
MMRRHFNQDKSVHIPGFTTGIRAQINQSNKKSKPGAKELHKANIADMDDHFLYFSNGNGQ